MPQNLAMLIIPESFSSNICSIGGFTLKESFLKKGINMWQITTISAD